MRAAIAPLTMDDYDEVIALWDASDGMGLTSADSRPNLSAYLERNPELSFIARDGGQVVGTVCCGHDGRRGYLGHLAVAPSHRGRGLARQLVDCCIAGLRAVGIQRCHIFVYGSNEEGQRFWDRMGCKRRDDVVMRSLELG